MRLALKLLAVAAMVAAASACSKDYETVKGDPMNTRIYTLDNGLKVYMTKNTEVPRIQTYIVVRSGGKNDPSDNTGLAHYLEHMMFKGTDEYGTTNYEAEKPKLDSIQALYDIYRTKTDPAEREEIYHQIDSISYEASKIAIPNEYDKMMSMIGSDGSNAFTSNDETCYQEDIPSNQIDIWARVQAGRFKNLVLRGFHTELEAVYEEKNRGLNDDSEKALDALDSMLFPHHPYGTQTVIGTQDHLKNPSITAIKKQYSTYYVPNNCAICLSGDFDYDEMLGIIKKYFGDWKANPDLPRFTFKPESPRTEPAFKDVYGTEAEFAMMAWSYPGLSSEESDVAEIAGSILYNGMAGLVDLDVNQDQKTLGMSAFPYGRTDYGMLILDAMPKQGQSLDDLKDIMLEEVAKLRNGDFDESMVSAAIENYKLSEMRSLESNSSRAMKFVDSFVNGNDWSEDVGKLSRIEKITKQDVVDWAGKYLGEKQYALVFKHLGIDTSIKKIDAPKITPIETNRDAQSAFLLKVKADADSAKPIEPVFPDYAKDLEVFTNRGIEVVAAKNEINDITTLTFVFDKGTFNDPALDLAFDYASYLGTKDKDAKEIAKEMYGIACDFGANVGLSQTSITVTGLSENIGKALDIIEGLYANAQPDENVLNSLKADLFKSRLDNKLSQRACKSALTRYMTYGPDFIKATTLTNEQVDTISSETLLAKVHSIFSNQHRVLYCGPQSKEEIENLLTYYHKIPQTLTPLVKTWPEVVSTDKPKVSLVQYDARQFNYTQLSNIKEPFDEAQIPYITLFDEYFSGSMNAVVFQEMREARALAYSAGANLSYPTHKGGTYIFQETIGSQNDKLQKAVEGFKLITDDMPVSQKNFDIAVSAIESRIRTERVHGMSLIWEYLSDKEAGLSKPESQLVFEKLSSMTLKDLVAAQQRWVKSRSYVYGILGDAKDLDMNYLKTLGPVEIVPLTTVFGY